MKFLGITITTPEEKALAEIPPMTEAEEPGQGFDRWPIPVTIITDPKDTEVERTETADRASYNTYNLVGTMTAALLILPYNPYRKRAQLIIPSGVNGQPIVWLHNDPNVILAPAGAQIPNTKGSSIELENKRALYVFCTGGGAVSCNLSVIDESYDTHTFTENQPL